MAATQSCTELSSLHTTNVERAAVTAAATTQMGAYDTVVVKI